MHRCSSRDNPMSIGIIGMGAFGTLAARHLAGFFQIFAHDPHVSVEVERPGVRMTTLQGAACRDIVLVATPVSSFGDVLSSVARFCRPGALVMDVGSVKVAPADLMVTLLPEGVDIVATHPLFGPQSAHDGLKGLKIAVCPVRCRNLVRITRFLSQRLELDVIVTTPEEHDRETAFVQGLTHLIAKVLLDMGPLPNRMTTRSYELLVEAIAMVKDDAPEVFEAIERDNPFSAGVRQTFFDTARRVANTIEPSMTEAPDAFDMPPQENGSTRPPARDLPIRHR